MRLDCGGIVLSADQGGIKGCGEQRLIEWMIHPPPEANKGQKMYIKGIVSAK